MSTRSVGRKAELLCKKQLEQEGWLVYLVDMPRKFKRQQDIFNMFDGIALRKGELLMFQVTTGTTRGKIKQLKEFTIKYALYKVAEYIQVWVWIKRKGFKIYDI